MFYDRYNDDNVLDLIELPPLLNTYTTNYTTLTELLASPLTATPTAVRLFDPFDAADRLQLERRRAAGRRLEFRGATRPTSATRRESSGNADLPINGRPYGYAYQPSSLDPTNVSGGITQPLPDDLLRPYQGYGEHHAARVQGLLRLPLAAVLGEPPPLVATA